MQTAQLKVATEAEDGSRGPLNRMDDWPNDDLLLTEHARTRLERNFPGASRVFNWPAIREIFAGFDNTATASRRRRQRTAFLAVSIGGLGALLGTAFPLIELLGGETYKLAFASSALLSLVGIIWTLWLVASDRHKEEWLEHRLRTERLRQFYFQFMISNPELAARAMKDDTAYLSFCSERDAALDLLKAWLSGSMTAELTAVLEDVNNKLVWQCEQWEEPPQVAGASESLTRFLTILNRQRIGIQLAYVREKLTAGFGSPQSRLRVIQVVSWICATIALCSSLATAVLLFLDYSISDISIRLFGCLTAFVGVLGLYSKIVGDGLQLKTDVERYHWYRAAVADMDARFHNPDAQLRIAILRELELASYREMREFLVTHNEAGFSLV